MTSTDNENAAQAPVDESKKYDLKNIAIFEKKLVFCVAASLIISILSSALHIAIVSIILWLANIVVFVLTIKFAWALCKAFNMEKNAAILRCILLIIPIVNLVVLFLLYKQAQEVLSKAGVKVGPLGVAKEDLEKL